MYNLGKIKNNNLNYNFYVLVRTHWYGSVPADTSWYKRYGPVRTVRGDTGGTGRYGRYK